MRRLIVLAVASSVGLTVPLGCSPYDPSLGSTPFLCGSQTPPCPDGFDCIEQGVAMVCVNPADVSGSGGSGDNMFPCADDSAFGSNHSTGAAYQTPVGDLRASITYGLLSICPTGDLDFFKVDIPTQGETLSATLAFQPAGDPLQLLLLDTSGNVVAMGSGTGLTLQASVGNEPAGTAFVEVSGPATPGSAMGENNYDLMIAVGQ